MTRALAVVFFAALPARAELAASFAGAQALFKPAAFKPIAIPKAAQAGPASLLKPAAERAAAPDFTLTDRGGAAVSLRSLRGQVVIVDLFGTWCGPCRQSIPGLVAAYPALQSAGIALLAVGVGDTHEKIDALERRMLDEGKIAAPLNYPIVADPGGGVLTAFGRRGVPTYVVVDKQGRIANIVHAFSHAYAMALEAAGE